jgi:hypothetical protein
MPVAERDLQLEIPLRPTPSSPLFAATAAAAAATWGPRLFFPSFPFQPPSPPGAPALTQSEFIVHPTQASGDGLIKPPPAARSLLAPVLRKQQQQAESGFG